MADDGEQKSAALSYVFVIDDENHETHEIMCDMSTPKWLPPHGKPGLPERHFLYVKSIADTPPVDAIR